MLTIAPPDAAEALHNATFEALMWSMARPGETRTLPEAGLAPVIETLVDLECIVFAGDAALGEHAARTGALMTHDLAAADHVFLASLDQAEPQLSSLRCGSALYPDDGATLAVIARLGRGQRLRLTGPGIEGSREVSLGISPAFWDLRARLCAYPEGFDLLLIDGRDVVGIPRSTQVEVL